MLPNPRHWPWWGWALCVVATLLTMVLSAALMYRQTGMRELRAEVARMQAAGHGVVPADLSKLMPKVDRARQNRAWALFGSTSAYWTEPKRPFAGMAARFSISSTSSEKARLEHQTEIAQLLDDSKTARADWATLSSEGPLVLTGLGWLTSDPATSSPTDLAEYAAKTTPSLLYIRQMANALAVEARMATDPRPALASLDAIITGQDHPGSMLDAMILVAVMKIRDDAWLEAVLSGTDPQPWLSNTVPCLTRVADSFAIERMLWCGLNTQQILNGKTPVYSAFGWSGGSRNAWEEVRDFILNSLWWFLSPTDTMWFLRGITECERLNRDGHGNPEALAKKVHGFGLRTPTAAMALPNIAYSVTAGARADLDQRRYRLAGAIIHVWNTTNALPATLSELPQLTAQLAIPRADLPVIRYTRVSPTRFLLDSDPATPATPMVPSGSITAAPTLSGPYKSEQWSLELDLADLEKYP